MFSNVGWSEILVLLIVALVVLGPERLPGAVSWVAGALRKAREYATGATQQIKDEMGTDFEDLRKPLADLNELRTMGPKKVITKHLLDGDDSLLNLGKAVGLDKLSEPLNAGQPLNLGKPPRPSTATSAANAAAAAAAAAAPVSPTPPEDAPKLSKAVPPIDTEAT